jgi:hypothetical protein
MGSEYAIWIEVSWGMNAALRHFSADLLTFVAFSGQMVGAHQEKPKNGAR